MAGDNQYISLKPNNNAFVEVDLDPTFANVYSDGYLSVLLYIPSSAQPDLAACGFGPLLVYTDSFLLGINEVAGNYFWTTGSGSGLNFAAATFNSFVQLEIHAIAGNTSYDVRVNGTLYPALDSAFLPASGVNVLGVLPFPTTGFVGTGGGTSANDTIGADELSWAFDDWISQGGTTEARWAFDGTDPIGDASVNYPTPPWTSGDDGNPANLVVSTGGGTNADLFGPAPPPVDSQLLVELDGVDFSECALEGSVTRRLNRPAMASIKIPMDCAAGCSGPGSRLKISFDAGATLFFHGMVMDWELDGGEDMGYIVMNALDPMELWASRPARDGPDSADPGDMSKPNMFQEFGATADGAGPKIIQEMLLASEDVTLIPSKAEGPLFIDVAGGSFAAGGTDVTGAPVDWPMTIAEVVNLLVSTGEVDVVLTPIDTGGNMASIAVYNGDYGTDLSGSVVFEYGTGALNVRALRWNQDLSSVCNKLWYYMGPRVLTASDPAGDQHWCYNIQGDDQGLPGFNASSPYIDVINCRDDSQSLYGVRMDVQIFDGTSEDCDPLSNPVTATERELYRRLWIAESWARCNPRTLIHITPTRGTAIGSFDIGDLVGVTIGSGICGGTSGAQRVYQYTISWDEDGPFELSELQTSSDVGL